MKLSVDHSFHIGEQHLRQGKPNQDYTLSGTFGDNSAFAIVSDGCSSGGKTDIGSRLMSLALQKAVQDGDTLGLVERTCVHLSYMQRALELSQNDMLATSMLAVVHGDHQMVGALVVGDGVVIEQGPYGSILATKYEWSNNTPFYLAYDTAQRRKFLESGATLTRQFWRISDYSEYRLVQEEDVSPYQGMEGCWWYHEPPRGPWDLQAVAVFSDGILQIDQAPWQQVVWELMNFKSTSGQFATRRMNRFLAEAKKTGRGPLDDIAMAVIHLGNET